MTRAAHSLDQLAFIDVETTGLDPARDAIVEVGVCFVQRGAVVARRSWLLDPGRPLPGYITALTGLTDDDVAAAPPLARQRTELGQALEGWTLVAHNAEFEKGFLGPLIASLPMLDSCELLHLLYPELPSHSLDFLVRWADVGDGARHRALEDAEDTYLVLRSAFERVAHGGRRADVERLVRRLSPPEGTDAEALVRLLARLSVECAAHPPPERASGRVLGLVDEGLVGRLASAMGDPGAAVLAFDVERPLVDAVLEAARRVGRARGDPVTVALPQRVVRGLRGEVVLPRQQVCTTRVAELVDAPTPGGDEGRLCRAWLEAWAARSPWGDRATHSGWLAERHPQTKALLDLALGCTCTDPGCVVRRTERAADKAEVLVVSHELALDWLERGAPVRLVVGHAELLPEVERRRAGVTVTPGRLRAAARLVDLGNPGHGLVAGLREAAVGLEHLLPAEAQLVDVAARRQRPWLDVRDVLHRLEKDLGRALGGPLEVWTQAVRALGDDLGRVLQAPTGAFELRAGGGRVQLGVGRAGPLVAARLPAGSVLVSGVRGGARWATGAASWVPPALGPWSLEMVGPPLALPDLAKLAAGLGQDAAVTVFCQGRVDPLADALAGAGVPFRLVAAGRALRGRGVLVGQWTGELPPALGPQVVLYGLDGWRAAVVACGARHLTLASPAGVPDAVAAELADLCAQVSTRRLVTG